MSQSHLCCYSDKTQIRLRQLCNNHIFNAAVRFRFVFHNLLTGHLSLPSSAAAENYCEIAFWCVIPRKKNGIDSVGIVPCTKRLGVGLASLDQTLIGRGCCSLEHESAPWWQIISYLLYCVHLSARTCFFFCAWVLLFLFPVLPLCFLNAAYRLTMATGRGLLVVAVLMSGVRAHCQCIIINLKTI